MKTSVLIIAHNEEKYIRQCIESILNQTEKPDEIFLIVHNSTDQTLEIAQEFPITVIPFPGEAGPVYARMEGLRHVTGDIVLCIDGDSIAKSNWLEIMTDALNKNNNILVGSYIKFKGTILGNLFNLLNIYYCAAKNKKAASKIWGPSFTFWKKDVEIVTKILEESIQLSQNLHLSRNPDDYFMALFMNKHGNIEVINKTFVTQYTKEISATQMIVRNIENLKNGYLIRRCMSTINL